jgi:hypothetical protein
MRQGTATEGGGKLVLAEITKEVIVVEITMASTYEECLVAAMALAQKLDAMVERLGREQLHDFLTIVPANLGAVDGFAAAVHRELTRHSKNFPAGDQRTVLLWLVGEMFPAVLELLLIVERDAVRKQQEANIVGLCAKIVGVAKFVRYASLQLAASRLAGEDRALLDELTIAACMDNAIAALSRAVEPWFASPEGRPQLIRVLSAMAAQLPE